MDGTVIISSVGKKASFKRLWMPGVREMPYVDFPISPSLHLIIEREVHVLICCSAPRSRHRQRRRRTNA